MNYGAPVSPSIHVAVRRLRAAAAAAEADAGVDMMTAEQEMKFEAGVMLSWSACDRRRP